MKHDFIDKHSNLDSIIHKLDPRVKLPVSFSFLTLIALTHNLKLLGIYFFLLWVSMAVSKVPFLFYVKKLLMITPVVGVFSFFIYLSYVMQPRVDLAAGVLNGNAPVWETLAVTAARIYLSIIVITLLVSCTRFNDLLWSFRRFRLPLIVTILSKLVYTYIFVFIDELHRTMRAYKSRTPERRSPRVKVYGYIAAGILLRSIDRSEYIYKAMLSRGFDGQFPDGNSHRLKWPDFIAVLLFLSIIIAVRALWNL